MTLSHSPNIVRDGLVLYLDAANPKSYPGTGTTWTDLSGNNNAIKRGSQSPTYPQHNDNLYFTFTGGIYTTPYTSDHNYSRFDVSNIPSFSNISVFSWYRTSDTVRSKTILRMSNSDFELSVNGVSNLSIAAGTNWNDINANTNGQQNATDGNWHCIGLTFNGSILKGYFDNLQVTENTRDTPATTEAGTLRIGTRNDTYNAHFIGDISVIKIYDRVLSDNEIKQNFNALRGRYGI